MGWNLWILTSTILQSQNFQTIWACRSIPFLALSFCIRGWPIPHKDLPYGEKHIISAIWKCQEQSPMKLRIWDGCSSLRCHFTSPFVRSKMWSLQNLTRHDHWKAKVTMAHGFRDICVWGRYDDTMWYASHQLHKLHHMFCKPCIVLKIPKIQTNWHYWDRFLTTSTGAIDSSPSSSLKFWIGKSSIIELRPLTVALTDRG